MSDTARLRWQCRDRELALTGRPLIMGILNVTPDSFSDGGRYVDPGAAVARARRMIEEGADLVDVGGESTRPGAQPVPEAEECRRVAPVIEALAGEGDVLVSVDTRKAAVARRALAAGAAVINDVTALTGDPAMAGVAAESGAGLVLMHMRGRPETMQRDPRYDSVVEEVTAYLAGRLEALAEAGIEPERMTVDPGIGFGKTVEHNLALLRGLRRLAGLGRPVVVGLSRKSFLGALTGRGVDRRLAAGLAALSWCVSQGAHVLRVHDVAAARDAAAVAAALAEEA